MGFRSVGELVGCHVRHVDHGMGRMYIDASLSPPPPQASRPWPSSSSRASSSTTTSPPSRTVSRMAWTRLRYLARFVLAFNKRVTIQGNDYEVSLVDTAGQDEYSIMPPEYSVDIHGYVLVYSIDSSKSFEVCQILHEKLIDLIGNNKWVVAV